MIAELRESYRNHGSQAELAKLTMLRGRTPETPSPSGRAFATLALCRDSAVFTGKFTGERASERHTNGDEIVQIVDTATLRLDDN
jgi:hypothetical protein